VVGRLKSERMKTARENILIEGSDDSVDLGRIHYHAVRENPSASLSDVQSKTLEIIRALADDELVEIGSMSGEGGRFVTWDTPLDESMKEIHDVYINDFHDRALWVWYCWLSLTAKGEQVAEALERKYAEVRSDS
jgi:hypothetical protein